MYCVYECRWKKNIVVPGSASLILMVNLLKEKWRAGEPGILALVNN
jgi:hypothetical protein